MNILHNFHDTSRFTANILGLKLEELLNNNKPTSSVYSKFISVAAVDINVVLVFSTVKIRADKEKTPVFSRFKPSDNQEVFLHV